MILCNDETKDLPSAPELLYSYYLLQLCTHTDLLPNFIINFKKTKKIKKNKKSNLAPPKKIDREEKKKSKQKREDKEKTFFCFARYI